MLLSTKILCGFVFLIVSYFVHHQRHTLHPRGPCLSIPPGVCTQWQKLCAPLFNYCNFFVFRNQQRGLQLALHNFSELIGMLHHLEKNLRNKFIWVPPGVGKNGMLPHLDTPQGTPKVCIHVCLEHTPPKTGWPVIKEVYTPITGQLFIGVYTPLDEWLAGLGTWEVIHLFDDWLTSQ